MRKILYSPGYGAGWTSWVSNPKMAKYMLEYQPIIEFLEGGGRFDRRECDINPTHPILIKLDNECVEKFGSSPYMGGAHQLEIHETEYVIRIEEYDGSERVVEGYSDWM